jgi:YbbR domain-containing protein
MFVGNERRGERKHQTLLIKHVVRKVFLEDWAMKLIALAITLGLWLGVTVFTKQGSARFAVPLNIRPSDNSILTNSAVKDVTIRVSGDDQKIRDLSPSDIRISLDLADVDPGEKIITITPQSVSQNLPSGVRLEDIQPRGIPVKLEAAEQKDVSVQADVIGIPAKGFEIYNESANPQRVRVRGPASYIRELDLLPTEKIDVSGRNADFVAKQVPVKLSNENTTLSDPVVDVSFHIGEKRIEKTLLVPVSGTSGKKATIVLYGPPTLLEGVKAENLRVELTKSDIGEETPNLVLPDALKGNVEIRTVKLRP